MHIRKWMMISGAMTAVFVAVMAFVHTPQGLAAWGRLRGTQRCPYGMDGSGSDRDAHRAQESARLRGSGKARSTQFLGFALNVATRADVDAWVAAEKATCRPTRTAMSDLECHTAGGKDASGIETLGAVVFFSFDKSGTLKSVHSMVDYADAAGAARAFGHLRTKADTSLGAEPTQQGEPSAAYLSVGLLQQVAAEYRLEDVYARLSATHMPVAYIVEEKYRAIAD